MKVLLSLNEKICCLARRIAGIEANFPTADTLSVIGVAYRTGTGWPLAADIPAGNGTDWWNTTTSTARHYINVAGALHYISFTT